MLSSTYFNNIFNKNILAMFLYKKKDNTNNLIKARGKREVKDKGGRTAARATSHALWRGK